MQLDEPFSRFLPTTMYFNVFDMQPFCFIIVFLFDTGTSIFIAKRIVIGHDVYTDLKAPKRRWPLPVHRRLSSRPSVNDTGRVCELKLIATTVYEWRVTAAIRVCF